MGDTETLVTAALQVLNTADPVEKARLGDEVATKWQQGLITIPYDPSLTISVPDRPSRLTNVKLVPPSLMPKLGKAGSLQSRQAIVHSLVHIESWAIDLSWDIIARFGKQELMPREFFNDFVKVAQDEGRHFSLLAARLEELGSFYGALPAHDGLWESATATSKDLLARLAVEHCVHEHLAKTHLRIIVTPADVHHSWVVPSSGVKCDVVPGRLNQTSISVQREGVYYGQCSEICGTNHAFMPIVVEAVPRKDYGSQARGLDVLPTTISRFRKGGDNQTADLLEKVIYPEEITHCAAGVKWFSYICLRSRDLVSASQEVGAGETNSMMEETDDEVISKFHDIVRMYFRGPLKPPFNEAARKAAGFGPQWYEPLATKEVNPESQKHIDSRGRKSSIV